MVINQNWQDAAYIFLLLMPILDGLRDGETMATNVRAYHKLGYLVRSFIAVLLLWAHPFLIPAYSAYFWIMFDATWNISAHKPIFYIGQTAFLDTKLAKKIYAAKILLLCLSIALLIFKNKL
jgi:hypothetical protein